MGSTLSVTGDLLGPQAIMSRLRVGVKPEALRILALHLAGQAGLPEQPVLDAILRREALGSTGVGFGVAVPHSSYPGIAKPVGLFARLERPIEFGAVDGRPVDLIFMLLSPEGEAAFHLKALAAVCRLLRDEKAAKALRGAADEKALYTILARA